MKKETYTTKEILFGLRGEYLRLQKYLNEMVEYIDYDKEKYEMSIVPVETIYGKDHNLVLYADEIKSKFRMKLEKIFHEPIKVRDAIIADDGTGNYILHGNSFFPEDVQITKPKEFNRYAKFLYAYDYLQALSDENFALFPAYSTPTHLTLTNDDMYATYHAYDDTVFISKNFRTRLTDESIYDILNCQYKATDFSDRAQQIIEESSSAQKDVTLLRKGRSVSEVFSIYEKQKTLVLTKK